MIPYSTIQTSTPADRFIEIGGNQLYVEQKGSNPDLPPILMLHGFAASTFSFHKIIPPLSINRRIIALDLFGFGRTKRPKNPDAYHPAFQIRTILKLLDHLEIDQCDLLGHSYGAALAAFLCANHPSRFRKLVLISPLPEFGEPPLLLRSRAGQWIACLMIKALLSRPRSFWKLQAKAYHQEHQLTDKAAEIYRQYLRIEGLENAVRGFSAAMNSREKRPISYEDIANPVLVLAGRHDEINPLPECEKVLVKLANGTLKVLENSGHSGPEEEPDEVVHSILSFL